MYCKYKCNTEARSPNHGCRGKEVRGITNSQFVSVVLVIQQAKRVRSIVLSVAFPALLYFCTLFHKFYGFRKKVTEHKMCFGFLHNFCLTQFSF